MSGDSAQTWLGDLGNKDLCSPFFDSKGTLHVIYQLSGEIWEVSGQGQMKKVHGSGGQLSSAMFDSEGLLYLADFAHGGILNAIDSEQELVVGVYEDRPLQGPNSIVDAKGAIYFTDSGPLGETGLHNPSGSLFAIAGKPGNQILKPISYANLAYPSGLAYNNGVIYVAETMTNRVLRFFQEPEGVFHGSVFYQHAGGVGPSCIAIGNDNLIYVGIYESSLVKPSGSVIVLNSSGALVKTISTDGAEITGVAINQGVLYITEKSTGTIQKFTI
jgi:sugar lactone lactonase YvrE